jgi:hypothetical protein
LTGCVDETRLGWAAPEAEWRLDEEWTLAAEPAADAPGDLAPATPLTPWDLVATWEFPWACAPAFGDAAETAEAAEP